jgi:hypothetical protein
VQGGGGGAVSDVLTAFSARVSIVLVDRSDPFASAASQHFNSLLERFGSPIIVFNLVKVRSKHTGIFCKDRFPLRIISLRIGTG